MSPSECPSDPRFTHVPELGELLGEVEALLRDYVVMGESERVVCSVWVAHTWTFSAWMVTPYLLVTSATASAGKTTLLELIGLVVHSALHSDNTSAAVLFRLTDGEAKPRTTLLLDEADAQMNANTKGDEAKQAEFRSIINGGFRRSGAVARTVGPNHEAKRFPTFYPKAIAGIGSFLSEATMTRTLPIRLQRKTRNEKTLPFRAKKYTPRGQALRERLALWAEHVDRGRLADMEPVELDELSDRQKDMTEPLLALADFAGGDWPERARAALLEMLADVSSEPGDEGVQLLADIRGVFERYNDKDRISSAELADALASDQEGNWAWWHDPYTGATKQRAQRWLADRLRPFNITSTQIRFDDGSRKGYYQASFKDAWERYLPASDQETGSVTKHPKQTMPGKGFPGTDDPKHEGNVSDSELPENPSGASDVSLVSDKPPVPSANDPETLFESGPKRVRDSTWEPGQ